MANVVHSLLRPLLDAFLPPHCLSCSRIVRLASPLCLSCFRLLETCRVPHQELPGITAGGRVLQAASYYRGGSPLRAVHHAAKYQQSESCARWLGAYLSRRLSLPETNTHPISACVSVPSHPARLMDRGIDVAAHLASRLAADNEWTVRSDLLIRIRLGIPQNDLDREERLANVRSVFGPGPTAGPNAGPTAGPTAGLTDTPPLHVLLVDDVVTTGATLDACASTLEAMGLRVSLAALAMRRELFDMDREHS